MISTKITYSSDIKGKEERRKKERRKGGGAGEGARAETMRREKKKGKTGKKNTFFPICKKRKL